MTRILILDDHSALRESLAQTLKAQCADFYFLHAKNGREAETVLSQNVDCSTLLLDIQLENENGLSLLPALRKIQPALRVLVYSAFAQTLQIEAAIKAGVQGFIPKTSSVQEIVSALKAVSCGNQAFSKDAQNVMKMLLSGENRGNSTNDGNTANSETDTNDTMELFRRYKTLSEKEQEVFLLIAEHLEIPEIAKQLKKSVKTVENQRTAIYTKMNVHDRLGCVEAAQKLGFGIMDY